MSVTLSISFHNFIHRFLFWVEFGNTAQISRANMDGTARICIATTNLGLPTGLAIDFACKYLNKILSQVTKCDYKKYFQPQIIMPRD